MVILYLTQFIPSISFSLIRAYEILDDVNKGYGSAFL